MDHLPTSIQSSPVHQHFWDVFKHQYIVSLSSLQANHNWFHLCVSQDLKTLFQTVHWQQQIGKSLSVPSFGNIFLYFCCLEFDLSLFLTGCDFKKNLNRNWTNCSRRGTIQEQIWLSQINCSGARIFFVQNQQLIRFWFFKRLSLWAEIRYK